MTQKQERQIRAISRFLRIVSEGDIHACAKILTAEAEILEGRDINKNIDTMIFALDAIRESCSDGIVKLKAMKEKTNNEKNLCYECAFFGYSPLGASACYKCINEKKIRLCSPYQDACKDFAKKGE